MVRCLFLLSLFALGLSTQTLAHTGVPSEPSGLHPIFHGDELVGGYTSKGYVHFPPNADAPTWRRAPATTGMYVAAYGSPSGRSFALTSAGLWEFSDGGCTYTEAEDSVRANDPRTVRLPPNWQLPQLDWSNSEQRQARSLP